ncbi:hypothetical protein CWE08_06610 [Aliidiomarina iranensis]|uniref:DUF192 domain-containing protein n=1 Tax=Aliidiomarina iranensis TaxID=1434071 RepID=A0A432VXD5_9GAMM|nr:DUF192 domain-containing protein [Aliidiomarina iranensis]RUO21248.1 hypothetical protein CWE08_06610 [Aliidiomarina iranensis]
MQQWNVRIKRHGNIASLACVRFGEHQFLGQLKVAASGWNRLLGWGCRGSALGIWLTPCRSIHTFSMKEAIDLLWLNKQQRVVHVETNVKPGSWRYRADAQSVVELPAGFLAKHGLIPKQGLTEAVLQ